MGTLLRPRKFAGLSTHKQKTGAHTQRPPVCNAKRRHSLVTPARRRSGRGDLRPLLCDLAAGRSRPPPTPSVPHRAPRPCIGVLVAPAAGRTRNLCCTRAVVAGSARNSTSLTVSAVTREPKQRSGWDVTLYESEKSFGGHTLTDETIPGVPVDLGFQVRPRAQQSAGAPSPLSLPPISRSKLIRRTRSRIEAPRDRRLDARANLCDCRERKRERKRESERE